MIQTPAMISPVRNSRSRTRESSESEVSRLPLPDRLCCQCHTKCTTSLRTGVLLTIASLTFQPCLGTADDAPDIYRQLISSIGSERATSGNGNKIVTVDGKTHIVWQDANKDGYFARARTLDCSSGKWSPTYTLGEGRDNHARPTITVDSKGFLHVIIGGHHSGLQYRRSMRPNDASEWTEIETFGKTTYPLLICGPDDTLCLTGRHDAGWKGMDFYAKPPGEKWQHRGLLVAKQKRYQYYAAYHNALAWGPNHKTLHMSVGFFMGDKVRNGEHARDPQGLHQAVGYMRSDDFGKTWTKADGTPIELPATTDTIDLIDEGTRARSATDEPKPGIRHCGIAVDSNNRPYVVFVRHTPDPGRIFLVTPSSRTRESSESEVSRLPLPDRGGWEHRPLQETVEQRWPGLAAIGCNVSMTRDDVLCLMLTLAPLDHLKANWSPGIYGRPAFWLRDFPNIQRLVWFESRDGGRTFRSKDIVPHAPGRGTLLPTQERPTGFNSIAPGKLPPLLYFEGLSRYRKPGEIIQNDVYFVQPH